MIVPEQRHFFRQREGRVNEPIEPEQDHALQRKTPPRGIFHDLKGLLELLRRLAVGAIVVAAQNAPERRLESLGQIALDLGPGGAEAGSAVQVCHARQIPRLGATRGKRLPGLFRIIRVVHGRDRNT